MFDSASYRAARRASRLLFCFSTACFLAVVIAAVSTARLATGDRVLLALVGAMPPLGFSLAVVLHTGRRGLLESSLLFFWRTVLAIVVLSLPAAYLLLRHAVPVLASWGGWAFVVVLIIFFLAPFQFLGGAASVEEASRVVVGHVIEVMWWPSVVGGGQMGSGEIELRRAPLYVRRDLLVTFQNTWRGRWAEALTAGEMVAACGRGSVSTVLDIGGGEGVLTRVLLDDLARRGLLAERPVVVVVDPINWEDLYRQELSSLGGDVRFLCGRFGEVERAMPFTSYDLVIASHSLYGVCDAPLADREANISQVVDRLCGLTAAEGTLVVTLAAGRSRAYEFKRVALRRLFGRDWNDLAAEDLRFVGGLGEAKCRVVDGVFDLGSLLADWESGQREGLLEWLRYFLRAPLQAEDEITEEIVGLLTHFLQTRDSLPDALKADAVGDLRSDARGDGVLLHKTHVWVR